MGRRRFAWWTPGRAVALALVLAAVSLLTAVPFGADGVRAVQLLHCLLLAVGAGMLWWRARDERRLSWVLIAVYVTAAAVAQVGWTRAGVLGGPEPAGTWVDHLYVAGLLVGAVGLLRLAFGPLRGLTRWRSVTDGLLVGAALTFLVWTFLLQSWIDGLPSAERSAATGPAVFIAIDCLAVGVFLLAAVYQPRRPVLAWVATATSMILLADLASALQAGADRDGPPVVSLAGWTMSCFAAVVIAVAPDGPTVEKATAPERRLVYASLVAVLGALTYQAMDHGRLDRTTLLLLIGLGALFLANQLFVNLELRSLQRATEQALRTAEANEARFRSVFDNAPVGMSITSADGALIDANPAAAALLGLGGRPTEGFRVTARMSEEQLAERNAQVAAVVSGERERSTLRLRFQGADGDDVHAKVTLSAYRSHDAEPRVIAVLEDVSEQERSRARLEYLATHDPLTALPNRAEFDRLLAVALAERGPTDEVAVAFIDLDQFKVINDSLGHDVGDELLVRFAGRLGDALDGRGTVARFGGDEFTVLVTGSTRRELQVLTDDLLEVAAEPVELPRGERFHPTVSIGLSVARAGSTPDSLVSEADAAMYRAKERGRNRVEWFTPFGRRTARVLLRTTDELHRALERGEFELHYQPIVERGTGRTVAAEALVRWHHPQRGLLPPSHFLAVAEESGLIRPIGDWVLRTATADAARWPGLPDGTCPAVSVNVGAAQLADLSLPDAVADALTDSGLPAERLWLEMTETAVMTDSRTASEVLHTLQGFGLHLALDDFGTGYSSLTYLKRFPFSSLKVDRSFVSGLGVDPGDTAIVSGVLGLARSLGLSTVAEGVETPLQLRTLAELDCEYVQGHLLGRPEAAPAFTLHGERRPPR